MKPQIRIQILTYKRAVCGGDVILHTPKAQQLDSSCRFMSSHLSDGSPSIYPFSHSFPIHPQCGVLVPLLFLLPLIVGHGHLLLKRQPARGSRLGHECPLEPGAAAVLQTFAQFPLCSVSDLVCVAGTSSASSGSMQMGVYDHGKPCPACALQRVLL